MPRSARPSVALLLTAAVVTAGLVALPATADAVADTAPPDFFSSFEQGDPQPLSDAVDTDAAGKPRASGVNGANGTDIPGDIRGKVTETSATSENGDNGEGVAELVDGTPDTKWLAWTPTATATITLSEPTLITHYAMTSANDYDTRDPQDWTLRGSADGLTWTDIDHQTGQKFSARFQRKDYPLAAPTAAFKYFQLEVSRNNGASIMQVSELLLANDEPAPPALPNMRSYPDAGPTTSYTSKTRVGFTGTRAFNYHGVQTDQHGWSYNKIYDVDIPVASTTELSYLVQPQFITDDLKYPSTNVALDLVFSDGTSLSGLGAVDEHGFALNPQAQGASKSLYANQWNLVRSVIGSVAKGKTIKKILLGYDNPNGAGNLQGWVDDIKVTATPTPPASTRPSDNVLTTRGTMSGGTFSRGNNFPATAVPHGFNFWTPTTNAGSSNWLYDYSDGNSAKNLPQVQAFSASHAPSPWMGDRNTFQVMPSTATGVPDANRDKRALEFKHTSETARAHTYGVQFENGIRTDIAPTDHAAIFRFGFPGADSNLIFDNVNNDGGLTLDPAAGTLSGYSDVNSGGLSAGWNRMFVYATFDKPVTAGAKLPGEGRDNVRGYLKFDAGADKTVTMRIATSLISVEQAKQSLAQEIPSATTFDQVRDNAQQAWDKQLKVVEVQGASKDQLTTLYSNLYRLFLYPNSASENTGSVVRPAYKYASPVSPKVGADTATQTGAKIVDGQIYVNNGFWDTYRTAWPAYSLLTPDMAGKMVDGFVQQYRDGGWISRWSAPGYANLMTGTSSNVAFADAYLKGVRNFDVSSAYDAAVRDATVTPPNDSVGRKGIDQGIFLGYSPNTADHGFSWSIEGYVNDFGIANMSKKLYDEAKASDPRKAEYLANYEYFTNRAQQYVNLFDSGVGFFQGRDAAGKWSRDPQTFDPRVWGIDYTETDAWGMAFSVPQDGQGLANLYGGKAGLASKLDAFFADQETANFPGTYGGPIHEMREARDVRMGQLGHSNQASHHTLYMYDYAGQPAKTQSKVREALQRLYTGSEIGQGYAGDEDNGEQSAWWLFSALGFYPLQMGSPDYAIGSPLFTKATIHLAGGKDLVINAPKNSTKNVYIQGVKVNGKAYSSTSLSHDVISRGGTIDFDMGPNPSSWGTGKNDAPKSITTGDAAPAPLHDETGAGKGTLSTSDSSDVNALLDNTSRTEAKVTGAVQYQLNNTDEAVTHYTLTSPKGAGDVKGWVLKGSYDGKNWAVADKQENQAFTWRQQTRVFKVAQPGHYAYYKLEVTSTSTGAPASLAEFELLGKPDAACTKTVTGVSNGPLTVSSGTVCLVGATVNGPVTVGSGASLIVRGGKINGPLAATGAGQIVLNRTKVGGPVAITGTTGTVSIEVTDVGGPVALTGNHGPVLTSSTVGGPLACAANSPVPTDYDLANTVRGPTAGQCATI